MLAVPVKRRGLPASGTRLAVCRVGSVPPRSVEPYSPASTMAPYLAAPTFALSFARGKVNVAGMVRSTTSPEVQVRSRVR